MRTTVLILTIILTCNALNAQVLVTSNRKVEASPNDWSVNYGPVQDNPPNYEYWRRVNSHPYVLSPYLMVLPEPRRPAVPAMAKYSDVDYGKVVEQVATASTVQPASARASVESVIDKAASATESSDGKKTIEVNVVDVLDRGLLVLDSYDEVKLRGVSIPSENEIDETTRYYARLGIDTLRRLLMNGPVYLQLGQPERSSDGPVLAEIFLRDGSLANRQILELGYGYFDSKDFLTGQSSLTLQAAELRARNARVGLFSRDVR